MNSRFSEEPPTIDDIVRTVERTAVSSSGDASLQAIFRTACQEAQVTQAAAIRCGHALIGANLPGEADLIFQALAARFPKAPGGLVGRARAAMKRRQWTAALDLWAAVITGFKAQREPQWLVARVTCALEAQGPSDWTLAIAQQAVKLYPGDARAALMALRVAVMRQDHLAALQRWRLSSHLLEDDLQAWAMIVASAVNAGDADAAREIIANAPPHVANTPAFKCQVVLSFHQHTHDDEAALALIAGLVADDLQPRDLAAIADHLVFVRQSPRAAALLRDALPRFAADRDMVRAYWAAVFMADGLAALAAAKEALLPLLDAAGADAALCSLPNFAALAPGEMRRLFDKSLADPHTRQAETFISKFLLIDNPGVVPDYADRLNASGRPLFRLVGRLLAHRQADLDRLAAGAMPPAYLRALVERPRGLTSKIDRLSAAIIERRDGAADLVEGLTALRGIGARAGVAWLNSRETFFDAAAFADWFGARVSAGLPTSLIRLGDGEGNFLPYPSRRAASQALDQRGIQQQWWGEPKFVGDAAADFSARLCRVVSTADAIGIPSAGKLVEMTSASRTPTRASRGWLSALSYFDEIAPEVVKDRIVTSMNIPIDLEKWDLFNDIFAAASGVSVVSCHDLAPCLGERFGVSVRRWFPIPEGKRFTAMFGRADDANRRDFYPEIFEEIMAAVSPRPGEIFLVGAGVLGKLICERVRERGGAALDIGSLADYWAGFATRRHAPPTSLAVAAE